MIKDIIKNIKDISATNNDYININGRNIYLNKHHKNKSLRKFLEDFK